MNIEHINNYRIGHLLGSVITITFSTFLSGYQIGVFNTSQRNVATSLGWEDQSLEMISINTAIMPVGAVVGSLVAGKLSNRYGRRKAVLMNSIVSILGSVINVIQTNATFTIGRFLGGFTAGLGCSIPPVFSNLYSVTEISPLNIAGKLGTVTQLQLAMGIFVSYALGLPLPVSNLKEDPMNNWWIALFLFPAVVSVVQSFLLLFVYKFDTPRWYMSKEEFNLTELSLKKLYKEESWRYHYAQLEVDKGVNDLENPTQESGQFQANQPSYRELLSWGKYRKPMIIGTGIAALQQLSGINIFMFYSSRLFESTGGDAKQVNYFTTAMGLFAVITTLIATVFIDSNRYLEYGRRILLMQGAIGMAVSNLTIGLFISYDVNPYLQLLPVFIFIAFFESSFGPIFLIYASEIINDKGVSLIVAFNWATVIIIGASFPVLATPQGMGIQNVFFMLAGFCTFGFLFVWLLCVETKGLKFEEVQKIMVAENVNNK